MRSSKLPFFLRRNHSGGGNDYNRINGSNAPTTNVSWKRLALGALVLILLVLLFAPGLQKEKRIGINHEWIISKPSSAFDEDDYIAKPTLQGGDRISAVPSPTSYPHSFDDHPDLKTVHCTKPYSADKTLVQYGLMIDAGSTGSRIHIYKFHNCFAQPTYEYEVFRQKRPGLSHFVDSPLAAAESLDELLDEAVSVVPSSLRRCTPVAVKATAGLRLLGTEQSTLILSAVKERIRTRYEFSLTSDDDVSIMEGKDEGVYAWMTANYLLDTLQPFSLSTVQSYAVLDLGGASTQIVFKPTFGDGDTPLFQEGDHKYHLQFAGANHTLYQHSYLGYGLMAARRNVHRLVRFVNSFSQKTSDKESDDQNDIANPCLSQGTSRLVQIEEDGKESEPVNMTGADVGAFDACRRIVELVMAKDAICQMKPCAFDGVYQPVLTDAFPSGKVLLLSYFYDRLSPLLPPPSPPETLISLPVSRIAMLAQEVCGGPNAWKHHFLQNERAMDELADRPEYCLDLTFMYTLLRLGYEFEDNREVVIAKQIKDTELGWALGAGIILAGGKLECQL